MRGGIKESEELFGGSVEGALFCFRSVPCEGSFAEVDCVEQELARVGMAMVGLLDDLADDLTADYPGVVQMAADGLGREAAFVQMADEWPEFGYEPFADGYIGCGTGPAFGPGVHEGKELGEVLGF